MSLILRTRYRTAIGQGDFTIMNQKDFQETADKITNVITIFLGGVARISLLVGGIFGILLGWGIAALVSQIAAACGTPLTSEIGLYTANRAASPCCV